MITYVKAGNSFIRGTPVEGLRIDDHGLIKVQHDGDYIGVRELVKNLSLALTLKASKLSPEERQMSNEYGYFLRSLRPVRSELVKALSLAEPIEVSVKRRSPPFKFRFFGSANEAFERFLQGDYRYILRKFDEHDPKHRLAYVKAFLMASQNPYVLPPEEEISKFLDYLHSINDSLLYGFYETMRGYIKGSKSLLSVHRYIADHADEIIESIKDEFSAALRSYEVGDPDVAREITKHANGVRKLMADATLILYSEELENYDASAMLLSENPDEAVLGALVYMEKIREEEPEYRRELFRNLHNVLYTLYSALSNTNLSLPSYIARLPILTRADTLIQYISMIPEGFEEFKSLMNLVPVFVDAMPTEIKVQLVHDFSLVYLYFSKDPTLVLRLYKTISQAILGPPDRVYLLPFFIAATYFDEELKYPMERLLIYAKERRLLLDAYIALKRALEINAGPVRKVLERRYNEVLETLEMTLEIVEL